MKTIEFGAKNPELNGWEYTIPEGMEATIENGKIILRERESEDERIMRCIEVALTDVDEQRFKDFGTTLKDCLAYLEKQKENVEKEYVFRPLAGTDITIAVEQAIRMAKEGHHLVLAFNGMYRPVSKYDSAKGLVEEYDYYLEKQKEQPADAKSERVIKAARRVLNNWLDGTDCPDVSGDFAELEHAIREYDGEEKQKEPEPTDPSNEELQRHQDELYDFKVFATKQAKEHHISFSFVHDFEWNNFCAELLSYFNEKQKPAECIEDSVKFEEGFKAGRESGLRDGQKYVLDNLDSYGLCKSTEEQSEEKPTDAELAEAMIEITKFKRYATRLANSYDISYKRDIDWHNFCAGVMLYFKKYISLRNCPKPSDSWKPSDLQMDALYNVINPCDPVDKKALESLYNDLKKL